LTYKLSSNQFQGEFEPFIVVAGHNKKPAKSQAFNLNSEI